MYYAFKNLFLYGYFFILPSNIHVEFLLNALLQVTVSYLTQAVFLCPCFLSCSHQCSGNARIDFVSIFIVLVAKREGIMKRKRIIYQDRIKSKTLTKIYLGYDFKWHLPELSGNQFPPALSFCGQKAYTMHFTLWFSPYYKGWVISDSTVLSEFQSWVLTFQSAY